MRKTAALIMPALNEATSVVTTLNSVFASTRLPEEIIVADGGSKDETVALVKSFSQRGVTLKVVENSKVFAGAGRNVAVAQTQCDVVLLLDFGNTIAPDWIEKMMVPFERSENVDYVCGVFLPIVQSDFEHCVACIHYHLNALIERVPLAVLLEEAPKSSAPGALSFAVTRSVWQAMGGMPDWLRAAEDNLFGRKLFASGARFEGVPQARQYHHMRSNQMALFSQLYTYSRGDARTGHVRAHGLKLWAMTAMLAVIPVLPLSAISVTSIFSVLFAAYIVKTGVAKVVRVDGKLRKKRYVLTAASVVLARDLGTLAGSVVGFCEWVFVRKYRLSFNSYFKSQTTTALGLGH